MCEESQCERADPDNGNRTCFELYNCCNCGVTLEDREKGGGCMCRYCFSCNACEHCLNEDE